ncbi:FAD-linked oxidoreductase [Lipomyces tetrasporus]|uniref:FAD-linked oxidoreductase n=1 Tax=Lipomyces tetrasporus TaxID=54092 RepID=A0AAD7VRS8_9ASCO|nr:FAD-linked oxidoreductase [Lipomyces tetrasporus]KAJ8100357.1 FAD-linked oxidoreductase [Lipomyces tetrasporus]
MQKKLKRWSLCAERQAGAVVLAESAEHISQTILFSRENLISVAVCGGGHSTAGSSSVEGAIVIDLSSMRNVDVDANNKIVTAQGGALWVDVDVATEKYGLATVGGTVNHTGIGGVTLGGGHGWLTGKYGQVVDNLLSVKLVLADGSLVTASETENSELFWAVRGAGQNFGVAVEFTYSLHDQPNRVWAGLLLFSSEKLESVVQFTNHIAATTRGENAIAFGFSAPAPLHLPRVIVVVFYDGVANDALKVVGPLLSLEPVMNTTAEMPYSTVNSILNHVSLHGSRRYLNAATFLAPLNVTFVRSLFDDFRDFCQKIPSASESLVLFEIICRDKICQVSPSAMAYANRGRYYNAVLGPCWHDPAFDSEMRAWAKRIANRIQNEAGKDDPADRGTYANYANVMDVDVPLRDIFGQNLEKLQMLKAKYDPDNVFNKWHNLARRTVN